MNYRIIIETELSGKNWYYVQKKWFFFWSYLREVRDITMYSYKSKFNTIKEAEEAIKFDKISRYNKSQKQIINKQKLEYVKEYKEHQRNVEI